MSSNMSNSIIVSFFIMCWHLLYFFGPGLVLGILCIGLYILYGFKNPGTFEKSCSWLFRTLQKFIKSKYDYFDKQRIRFSCEATIKTTISSFADKCEFLTSQDISIKWVDDGDNDSALKDGTIYIRIKRTNNDEDNVINALFLAVQASVLPDLKKIMDKEQQLALDLFITYIFSMNMDKFHRNSFNKFYEPILKKKSNIQQYFDLYDDLYKHGVFHGVFMHELLCVERENRGRIDTINISKLTPEISNLLETVKNFSHRYIGDNNENFGVMGTYIDCFMMIFAKSYKVRDITPHIDFIEELLEYDYMRCYVFSQTKLHSSVDNLCNNLSHICFVESRSSARLIVHEPYSDRNEDLLFNITLLQRTNNSL